MIHSTRFHLIRELQSRLAFSLSFVFLGCPCLFASASEHAPTDSEARLDSLEKRLTALEKENGILRQRLAKLEGAPAPIQPRELADILPKEEKEKKSFLEAFRRELKSDLDRASGPWTSPDSWALIRKRMSSFEVRETLGRPTRMKPSVRPAIDEVYFYKGDLDADGIEEEGVVNFKDKRVVSFESPHSD